MNFDGKHLSTSTFKKHGSLENCLVWENALY